MVLPARLKRWVDADMSSWSSRPRDRQRPYLSWWRHFDPARWDFCGPYHFMLYHGRFWYWQPHPPWCPIGKLGRCGQNALRLAMKQPGLTYVEGVAWTPQGLIEHSWVVDQDRLIVDPTWGDKGSHQEYFGVPFKTAYIRKVCARGIRGSIIHNWHDSWPLLRGLHARNWKAIFPARKAVRGAQDTIETSG
jgi:hypothetical protein